MENHEAGPNKRSVRQAIEEFIAEYKEQGLGEEDARALAIAWWPPEIGLKAKEK